LAISPRIQSSNERSGIVRLLVRCRPLGEPGDLAATQFEDAPRWRRRVELEPAIRNQELSFINCLDRTGCGAAARTGHVPNRDVYQIDLGWFPGFAVSSREGTIAVADYVITSSIAFIVFTFSSLIVAIQVASGQLTPRIIATTLLRDNTIRGSVAVFVYALLLQSR
jgi:hypothetical protein